VLAIVSPVAYSILVAAAVLVGAASCAGARRRPGRWASWVAWSVGLVLAGDAVSFAVAQAVRGAWSPSTSLPLALCDMAVLVAVAACWWRLPLLVELTWFCGLAGTVQAVITPDLNVPFPHLVFFQYLVGHLGIVLAAVYLVVGMRITPRPGAVRRIFGILAGYTVFVGCVDAVTGANYMFLRSPPPEWTVLRLLGPWPWYVPSAAVVTVAHLSVLNTPFWWARRQNAVGEPPRRFRTGPLPTHPGSQRGAFG
jgi:hypothetical integral membrane protein (TIGR02206 family)